MSCAVCLTLTLTVHKQAYSKHQPFFFQHQPEQSRYLNPRSLPGGEEGVD